MVKAQERLVEIGCLAARPSQLLQVELDQLFLPGNLDVPNGIKPLVSMEDSAFTAAASARPGRGTGRL